MSQARLYVVGPSFPRSKLARFSHMKIVHTPSVRLQPLPISPILKKKRVAFQSLVITSPYAARQAQRIFCRRKRPYPLPEKIFCTGKATEKAVRILVQKAVLRGKKRKRKVSPHIHVAEEETQEGVIELIKKSLSPQQSTPLIWVCSAQSRRKILTCLAKEGFSVMQIIAYTPLPIKARVPYTNGDTIFFSCPSSVRSFFSCNAPPPSVSLHYETIGPITHKALQEVLSRKSTADTFS